MLYTFVAAAAAVGKRETRGVFRFSASRSDEPPFFFVEFSNEERAEVNVVEVVVDRLEPDASVHVDPLSSSSWSASTMC